MRMYTGMLVVTVVALLGGCFGIQQDTTKRRASVALTEAIQKGDRDRVKLLVARGTHLEVCSYPSYLDVSADNIGPSCWRPLMYAAWNGDEAIVRLLIDAGAELDGKGSSVYRFDKDDGWTPLMAASYRGHADIVTYLIEKGASPNARTSKGLTSLDLAHMGSHQQVIDFLEKHGGIEGHAVPIARKICTALKNGDAGSVEKLIKLHKRNVEEPYQTCGSVSFSRKFRFQPISWRPLMWASWFGHTDIVRLVLDHGASVDGANRTLLLKGKPGTEPQDNNWTALMAAAIQGHKEIVALLLTRGANPNARTVRGSTVMDFAWKRNPNLEIVKALQDRGAAFPADASRYWARLACSDESARRSELISILVEQGIQPSVRSLDCAIKKGDLEMMNLLVQRGADVHGDGWCSPLSTAVESGNMEATLLLLKHGTDPNERGPEARTPLHLACQIGNAAMCKVLLEHGANPNAPLGGWTPLKLAEKGAHKEIVDLLKANGAIQ